MEWLHMHKHSQKNKDEIFISILFSVHVVPSPLSFRRLRHGRCLRCQPFTSTASFALSERYVLCNWSFPLFFISE